MNHGSPERKSGGLALHYHSLAAAVAVVSNSVVVIAGTALVLPLLPLSTILLAQQNFTFYTYARVSKTLGPTD
jgi:hypothetical protein